MTGEVKRILVIDDETDILESIRKILVKAKYAVITAKNGREGLNYIRRSNGHSQQVHLIVTDILMPGFSGMDMIDSLHEEGIEIPFLVLSGLGSQQMVVDFMRRGCMDFIDKPFRRKDLLERIHTILTKVDSCKSQEKRVFDRQIEAYQNELAAFKKQFIAAKGVYRNLVQIKEENCIIPFKWRIKQYADLGGDFFDIQKTRDGCDILVADVSGHDLGASYHTILLKTFFKDNALIGHDGEGFFNLLNHQLLESGSNERMVTAVFVSLNFNTMKGEVVSAGHPPIIKIPGNRSGSTLISATGDVLGILENVVFEMIQFDLRPGDRFFLYTDGAVNVTRFDGMKGTNTRLTVNGLETLIKIYRKLDLDLLLSLTWQDILTFCKFKQVDDMLLLGFEIPAMFQGDEGG